MAGGAEVDPEVYDDPADRVQRVRSLASVAEARELYDRWAVSYDDDVYGALGFVGTDRLVERIASVVNPSVEVLDAGCGTGAVGERLAGAGFTTVDGLDLSPKMLRVASHKNVYRKLLEADLTERLDIPDASYDAVVSAGTFVSGHVAAAALTELIRITRPGGVLIFTVMESFWEPGGFPAVVAELEASAAASLSIESTDASLNHSTPIVIVTVRLTD